MAAKAKTGSIGWIDLTVDDAGSLRGFCVMRGPSGATVVLVQA